MERKRAQHRIEINRPGKVFRGSAEAPCELLELTERGVLLATDLPLAPGDECRLETALEDTWTLQCTIVVKRVEHARVGGEIGAITPEQQAQLSHFIDRIITMSLSGL
jgi:hypothetical protein